MEKQVTLWLLLLSLSACAQTRLRDIPAATNVLGGTKLLVDDGTFGVRSVTWDWLRSSVTPEQTTSFSVSSNLLVRGLKPSLTVDSVAALTQVVGVNAGDIVATTGYYAAGDGGHGMYRWVSSFVGTTNTGTAFAGTAGFWLLVHDGVVTARQFGAVGDGSTDDTLTLQGALDDATVTTLVVPNGVFRTTELLCTRGITIEGPGTLRAIEDARILQVDMPWSVYPVTTITNAVITITSPWRTSAVVTDDWAEFAIGDVVKLTSNDPIVGSNNTVYHRGEFGVVALVETGVVYLTAPLRNEFPTGPRIVLYDRFQRLVMRGIRLRGGRNPFADSGSTPLIWIRAAVNPVFDSIAVSDAQTRMLILRGCFGATVTGSTFENGGNLPSPNQYGYGIEVLASANTAITGCTFRNLRHGVDTNPAALATLPAQTGRPTETGSTDNLSVAACSAWGCSNSGFSTHAATYGAVFSGCVVYGSYRRNSPGKAFDLRGENITAIGCAAYNCRAGFDVFSDGRFGPDTGIRIIQCEARDIAVVPIRSNATETSPGIGSVTVDGGYFETGATFMELGAMTNLVVRNAQFVFKGHISDTEESDQLAVVYIRSQGALTFTQSITIDNCQFDFRLAPTNRIERFFTAHSSRPFDLTIRNSTLQFQGVPIAILFASANSASTLLVENVNIDAVPVVTANTAYSSARISLRGAIDTRIAARNLTSSDNNGLQLGRITANNAGLDRAQDAHIDIPLTVTTENANEVININAVGAGAYRSQAASVSFRTAGSRIAGAVRIPGQGFPLESETGLDVVLRPNETASLVWDGTVWRARHQRIPQQPWWQSLGGIQMLGGMASSVYTTNRIYSQITSTNWNGGQPWTVSWAGFMPINVQGSSVGLVQVAPSGTTS
jgi:hypothetical protein